jgi:hypothetical protein
MALLVKAASTCGKFMNFPQNRRCYIREGSHLKIKLAALQACKVISSNMDWQLFKLYMILIFDTELLGFSSVCIQFLIYTTSSSSAVPSWWVRCNSWLARYRISSRSHNAWGLHTGRWCITQYLQRTLWDNFLLVL